MDLNLKIIGQVKNGYHNKFGTPRQSGLIPEMISEVVLEPWVQAEQSLQGLEEFDYLWLLWWFDQSKNKQFLSKVYPPRMGDKKIGVFATRSPHRPNPLGLSLVQWLKKTEHGFLCAGADLINGTFLFDIKPYLPELESKPNAKQGWLDKKTHFPVSVIWEISQQEYEDCLKEEPNFCQIAEKMIASDPRPKAYKNRSDYIFSIYLAHHDIKFQFLSDSVAVVKSVTYSPTNPAK